MFSYEQRCDLFRLRFHSGHDLLFLSPDIHWDLESLWLITTTWRLFSSNVFIHLTNLSVFKRRIAISVVTWNCRVPTSWHREPFTALVKCGLFDKHGCSSEVGFWRTVVLGAYGRISIAGVSVLSNVGLKSVLLPRWLVFFLISRDILLL